MNNKITFSQLKSLVMEAKGSIDAEWKKYQANLKKILSYVPRLKKLDIDGLLLMLKNKLDKEEFYDLFNTERDDGKVGIFCLEPWDVEDEVFADWIGVNEISYGYDVRVDSDGNIYNGALEVNLVGNGCEPDVKTNHGTDIITKDDVIKAGGLDGSVETTWDEETTYRELFNLVKGLADGIGPYLDKFEKVLDENGLKSLANNGEFVIKNGVLEKYNGKGGDIVIPDGVAIITDWVFDGCSELTSVTIPDSVTSIYDHAFSNCPKLASVTIGNGVTSIGDGAFEGCSELTSFTIGNGVTSIGRDTFHECSKLTSVTIPDSVTSIGADAFASTNLTSVIIPKNVTAIEPCAFGYCYNLASVRILNPKLFQAMVKDPDFAFEETPWAEKIKSGNITFDNGLETNKETGTLDSYFGTDRSVSIPADVTTIGVGAFEGNSIIGTVTIPDTVAVISSNAFANCSGLTSITLGSGIKRIEKDAFKGVSEHITVYVPNFAMCELLIESGLPDSAIIMVGNGGSRRRVALDPEEVRESEDYDEVEVDEPYRDCEITIHTVQGNRKYGMKHYNDIRWFESKRDLVHWLHCGIAGTDGAEQDHYYSMLDQLEDGKTVVDYNYEW